MQNNNSPNSNNNGLNNGNNGAVAVDNNNNNNNNGVLKNDVNNNYLSPNSNGATDDKISMSPEFQQQKPSITPQPMAAVQQHQQQQTKLTFIINGFSKFENQFYTQTNTLWGLTWRLYVFPKGNTSPNDLSLFLDMNEIKQQNFPNQKVNFVLEMVNQKNPEENVRKTADHIFNIRSADWGFNKFMKIPTLLDPKNGFIVDDTIIIHAHILNVIPEVITANGQRTFIDNLLMLIIYYFL
ncbi:meprin and TRAF domain-containing protein [Heterostelium album PN500]|uniref:Meprin and TRAF domain-containing protein n=1 Tax=Heterostelium pallidum (strain ATCC 26659 / Pp 5 / PN500) TaxID=670386 RepID=D3B795_HETP5|nr:meprin and TRAF domain-containing protein [Heterostelium album PN500]EFA82638.1 meprin and TRAF domain-containing protein [Heterostelium album PN500]|eukprot:XP_020434755.1 meprin and TRAF domain-containing protein [Heterostelium album PN500]